MARPGGTLKGEDDRRFRLYTVIRIKIRSRVSIAREIGFRLSIAAAGRSAARHLDLQFLSDPPHGPPLKSAVDGYKIAFH